VPTGVLLLVILNGLVLIGVDLAVVVLVDEGEDPLHRRFITILPRQ
jgi:hypothetical protein